MVQELSLIHIYLLSAFSQQLEQLAGGQLTVAGGGMVQQEMCIRDRAIAQQQGRTVTGVGHADEGAAAKIVAGAFACAAAARVVQHGACLLYTSNAG